MMKYCKVCLQNNLRPNILFTNGLCPSCYYIDRDLDEGLWKKRFKILKSITDKYKNNESGYDCIIGLVVAKTVRAKPFG